MSARRTVAALAVVGALGASLGLGVTLTAGPGSASPDAGLSSAAVSRPGAPGVPTIVSVGNRAIRLRWTAAAPHGSAVTSYTVLGTGGFTATCPQTTCTLRGLTNGKAYGFLVAARNKVGLGPASAPSATATPRYRPPTPARPTVKATGASGVVKVGWKAVSTSTAATVRYEVRAIPGTVIVPVSGTAVTLRGLTDGSSYAVQVRALVGGQSSAWSASATVVSYGRAPLPTSLKVAAGKLSQVGKPTLSHAWVHLTWCAKANGRPIDHFEYRSNDGAWKAGGHAAGTAGCWYQDVKLDDFGTYWFDVRAVDTTGLAGYHTSTDYWLPASWGHALWRIPSDDCTGDCPYTEVTLEWPYETSTSQTLTINGTRTCTFHARGDAAVFGPTQGQNATLYLTSPASCPLHVGDVVSGTRIDLFGRTLDIGPFTVLG